MGKKIRAEMDAQRKTFVDGATGRGIEAAKAEEVFDLMAKFADYGFNRSHAAAYALVSYQTAWLKANRPVAFIAACMSLAINNTDKLAAFRQEASRMNIPVLPPDINRSMADFALERQEDGSYAIRYALAAVKKVGLAAMRALAQARGGRPFADLADFASRVDPKQINKMQIENLVRAGAFDGLDRNRARAFAGAETILRRAQAEAEENESGQIGLFGNTGAPEKLRLPDVPDWPAMDRLGFEADAVGFHLTAHPLDVYTQVLRRLGVVVSTQLETRAQAGAARVKVAGTVISSKERITRTGSRMAWIRLSDTGGSYEITVFSEVLARSRELLAAGNSVLVSADIRLEGEALRITANEVSPLEQAAAQAGAGMRVWLQKTESVPHIRTLLEREGKGRGRVVLLPKLDGGEDVEIVLPGGFNVTPRLAQAMKILPGVERVEDI
jgi:DNA polymerase-3 subunit alpha